VAGDGREAHGGGDRHHQVGEAGRRPGAPHRRRPAAAGLQRPARLPLPRRQPDRRQDAHRRLAGRAAVGRRFLQPILATGTQIKGRCVCRV
jgi:hypothetical protein